MKEKIMGKSIDLTGRRFRNRKALNSCGG